MPKNPIRIGTRGSKLALWQANFTKNTLDSLGYKSELIIIKTKGDEIQNIGFDKMEGKGFFTKEIEQALLENKIDVAVHSHKDLETSEVKGLQIAAVSQREDPSELLLIRKSKYDASLKWGILRNGVIGTSSARRKSLIVSNRSDLLIKDLRGNVPTRIQKLREGHYDAILLAFAGVKRLDISLDEFETLVLSPAEFVPAAAQGALAFQIRKGDFQTNEVISKLNHNESSKSVALERKILNQFGGGCQIPIGIFCNHKNIFISYSKSWEDGSKIFKFERTSDPELSFKIVDSIKSS